jgi:hypothetical protein
MNPKEWGQAAACAISPQRRRARDAESIYRNPGWRDLDQIACNCCNRLHEWLAPAWAIAGREIPTPGALSRNIILRRADHDD